MIQFICFFFMTTTPSWNEKFILSETITVEWDAGTIQQSDCKFVSNYWRTQKSSKQIGTAMCRIEINLSTTIDSRYCCFKFRKVSNKKKIYYFFLNRETTTISTLFIHSNPRVTSKLSNIHWLPNSKSCCQLLCNGSILQHSINNDSYFSRSSFVKRFTKRTNKSSNNLFFPSFDNNRFTSIKYDEFNSNTSVNTIFKTSTSFIAISSITITTSFTSSIRGYQ